MKCWILCIALCMYAPVWAQKASKPVETDSRLTGVDAELQKVLQTWKAAGFAVAVVEKNKVVYAKGFGTRRAGKNEPVTPNTLFAIGSCTKAFTATLVGKLVAEGKATYDEPVRTYLPSLQFYNDEMNQRISLRDMMRHTTGLPRHDVAWYLNPSDNRDSLMMRIRYQEPTAKPGAVYQYNNFMFLAQGVLVEKLTGKTWEKAMLEQLIVPLGMTRTNMPYEAVKADSNLAAPHAYNKDSSLKEIPHYNIGGMGPAGSVYSSVLDMTRWLQTWIYGGKYNGVQIIPPAHYKEAISGQSISGFGMPDSLHPDVIGSNYGFGWSQASYKGHYRVEHGGAIDGFHATVSFFPTDSIGIVVLSNQDVRQLPPIVRNILADRMLGAKRSNWNAEWIETAKKAKAATAATSAKSVRHDAPASHKIKEYEGLYTHPGYGSYDVFVSGDSLILHTSRQKVWLRHWHYDVFVPYQIDENNTIDTSETSAVRFRFNTDVNGNIASMNAYGFEVPSIELVFKKMPRPVVVDKASLEKYTGDYELSGMQVKVYIKNANTLVVEVPGQPPYEQVPAGNHRFAFKTLEGFSLLFEVEEGEKAKALSFIQPNGTFKALRKK